VTTRRDLCNLWITKNRVFTVTKYEEMSWGFRPMSFPYRFIPNRFAIDLGKYSLLFENYGIRIRWLCWLGYHPKRYNFYLEENTKFMKCVHCNKILGYGVVNTDLYD
jgi:hypothetical protein